LLLGPSGLIVKYHTQIWNFIVKIWHDIFNFFVSLWNSILNFAKQWWPLLLGPAGVIMKYHGLLWIGIQSIWHTIFNFFVSIWNSIFNFFKSMIVSVELAFSNAWNSVYSTIRSTWNGILGFFRGIWSGIRNGFSTLVGAIGSIWNGIRNAVAAPVRFVINSVYDRIAGVVDDVTNFLHLGKPLPVVTMASGGRVPGMGRGDKVPALLEPDEIVLSNNQIRKAGGHSAIAAMFGPGGGSMSGGILHAQFGWNPISDITSLAKGGWNLLSHGAKWVGGHITGFIRGAVLDVIKPVLDGILNGIPTLGSGGWGAAVRGVPKFIVDSVLSWVTGQDKAGQGTSAAGIKYNLGGGVMQWDSLVKQALSMLGLGAYLASQVEYQMMTESGGNPNAINNWDINAQRGDPSRGLLQVIMSTFQAYHVPGTSWNIYDPLANIAAAINYAEHVYGPTLMRGGMGMGSGHGYAAGGATSAGWAMVGERGRELIRLPGGATVMPGGLVGAGGGRIIVELSVDSGTGAMRDLISLIREHIRVHGGLEKVLGP
jgi:SLT domain-containing protein